MFSESRCPDITHQVRVPLILCRIKPERFASDCPVASTPKCPPIGSGGRPSLHGTRRRFASVVEASISIMRGRRKTVQATDGLGRSPQRFVASCSSLRVDESAVTDLSRLPPMVDAFERNYPTSVLSVFHNSLCDCCL